MDNHSRNGYHPPGAAPLRLPRLISDGMVLQRDAKINIRGWAAPGGKVTVSFTGKIYQAITGIDGNWKVTISGLEPGGPYSMEIESGNKIVLKSILVGDVWICSGQSNMGLPMERVKECYPDDIANCENDSIRLFKVPDRWEFNTPQPDLPSGGWEAANPENILHFPAVGYFFAKSLFEKYRIPIGLINASIGGSPVEAWLSEEALKVFPDKLKIAQKYQDRVYCDWIAAKDKTINDRWYNHINQQDPGLGPGKKAWYHWSYDASAWPTFHLPADWDEGSIGNLNGVVWFRKEIDIPSRMTGQPAKLRLGRIVDSDTAYVNGSLVGTTSYQYPPRRYELPKDLLKTGKNVIVIRVINPSGRGGFIKDKPYQLAAGEQIIDLRGEWQYHIGVISEPLPKPTFFQYQPLGLFNGMIAPLLNNPIKGVIWYQGESNTEKPYEYQRMFKALIADWRQKWNQGNYPFLYVQLPNYQPEIDDPSRNNWPMLREAQLKTLDISNTGMAVTIDIGEWNDLHPLNKKDVGKRLALLAQKLAYGHDLVYSGPIYRTIKIEGYQMIITFTETGSGLVVKDGGELRGFEIAGKDYHFFQANAKIENDQVVVWNALVPKPVAVRYAWADNPEGANLYNQEGLPASPFRTGEPGGRKR